MWAGLRKWFASLQIAKLNNLKKPKRTVVAQLKHKDQFCENQINGSHYSYLSKTGKFKASKRSYCLTKGGSCAAAYGSAFTNTSSSL